MMTFLKNVPLLVLLFISLFFSTHSNAADESPVSHEAMIIAIDGVIGSGSSTFLARALKAAEERGSSILIIRLDTPGGLSTSMKTMVKAILNSPIPIVVYVAPKGASAASAGVLVTIAANIAAMSPGTNIGAAHPVQSDGSDIQKTMETKVVNDMAAYAKSIAIDKGRNAEWVEKAVRESVSITADEAVKNNVADLIATDIDDLLNKIDGREIHFKNGTVKLATKNLARYDYKPKAIDNILMLISDPTIMAILFGIGILGLGFEITHPGAVFPGVIGGISLILAFFSMQTLPINYAGLLLIALGVIFFIAEIKIPSYGLLSLGGIISLALGSLMFFQNLGLSLAGIIPFILIISGFFLFIGWLALKAQKAKPRTGPNPLAGEEGVVKKRLAPEGLIFIHGEYWTAVSDTPLEVGQNVKVEEVNGLTLKVTKA
jgi:membrane-bound serine protease (ClpP class)